MPRGDVVWTEKWDVGGTFPNLNAAALKILVSIVVGVIRVELREGVHEVYGSGRALFGFP